MSTTPWEKSTKRLILGVSFTTILLLIYNLILFIPTPAAPGNQVLLLLGLILLTLLLTYLCILNYLKGLTHFCANFPGQSKRTLWLLRWAFLTTLAGVALQLLFFGIFQVHPTTLQNLLLGNILLLIGTLLGTAGFLSLSAAPELPPTGRHHAKRMPLTLWLLLLGESLTSLVLPGSERPALLLKTAAIALNLTGAVLYFLHWKHILTPQATQNTTTPEAQQ